MAGIKYNESQIEEIKSNKYVKDCTSKYITFTDEFKIKVLELDVKWIYHRKIFEDFWFPDYLINSKVVNRSLWNWRYKLKDKWLYWLINTKKWRKKKEKSDISKMNLEEQIEYFKTENAFLKEMYKLKHWKYP